jgi:RNA 3'-terminal phosphate cyclase (ATP)
MLMIDGRFGEGGGQILRSSLGLSLVTGTTFRIEGIRAGRKKPGLMRQHLTAVRAAAEVGRARVTGDEIGSQQLTFEPAKIGAGDYQFAVGTAGSALLVLQTVLPPLMTAEASSTLLLEGGTHNPFAPPFEFLDRAFLPLICRMGPEVTAALDRPGFYPAGGGQLHVSIEPTTQLKPLDLLERGAIRRRLATAIVANLPRHIAERELRVIGRKLDWSGEELRLEEVSASRGPGNVVTVEVESEHLTEVFTSFGQRGVRAEDVARQAAQQVRRYLDAGVPVGEHLADQLLLPLALAGGGSFRTVAPSQHSRTNAEVVKQFLKVGLSFTPAGEDDWRVEVG